MLKLIAKYSTILMPLFSLLGMIFPKLSNGVLPYLPKILFFLMFFTLLGIDQKQLLKRILTVNVWYFAIFQSTVICLIFTTLAYAFGIRGDFLLAISAVSATAPLFGSGAIVNAVGFDALLAMAKTITATLIMPITLLIVLWFLGSDNAQLDFSQYFQRLLIYIILPMLFAIIVKYLIPKTIFANIYPKIAQFNIVLLLMFPLGLMGGFRQTFDNSPSYALSLLGLASLMVLGFYFLAYVLYRKHGFEIAIISALVCGGRNVLLTYTIATPFLGSMFLPLIGALQLPAFSLAMLGKYMVKRQQILQGT